MANLQLTLDRAAIGLSVLCAIHCLVLPVAMILGVSGIPFGLGNESFHKLLLLAILPTSLAAMAMGCRKHRCRRVYFFAAAGLLVLGFAGVFGHDYLGEIGEKVLTVIGGALLVVGHVSNYRLSRVHQCDFSSESEVASKCPLS